MALVASQFGETLAHVLSDDELPPVLCLDRSYLGTIGFVHDLRLRTNRQPPVAVRRQLITRSGRVGWIRNYQDFKSLKEISPGAALLLAAEYDRARRLSGFPLTAVDLHGWNPKVYATLSMLGFFDLLDLPQVPPADVIPGFHVEPMATGSAVNSQPALERIIALFERAGGDNRMRTALCGAVVDALENVRDHAYPAEAFSDTRHVPNWWFTGAADRDDRWLVLVIYDQGITIPVSLPRRFGLDRVRSVFQEWFDLPFDPTDRSRDGAALEAAMRLSTSSIPERFRGKGLAKIREVVTTCKGGRLRIVSRAGEYIFEQGRSQSRTHPVALPGTYVEIAALF